MSLQYLDCFKFSASNLQPGESGDKRFDDDFHFFWGEQFLDGWMGWLFYMFFFNIWENEVGFPMAILMVCFFLLNMENVGEFLKMEGWLT